MKTIIISTLLVVLGSVGCDKIVRVEPGTTFEAVRTRSCYYTGFCYDCRMNYRGHYHCGFTLSSSCQGHQQVKAMITPETVYYKSGDIGHRENVVYTSELEQCH